MEKSRNQIFKYDKPLDAMGCFPVFLMLGTKTCLAGELTIGGSNKHAKASWLRNVAQQLGMPAPSFTNQK